jgi:hypothetical protein
MAKTNRFLETFAAPCAIPEPHATRMIVTADEPGRYQLASPTMTDSSGRPLFCASVQIHKSHVSYHLMPVDGNKALRASLSPSLRKRIQRRWCFNFTTV